MQSCSLCVNVHNYFDGPTKLFLDLYLYLVAKFLDTSTKTLFSFKLLETDFLPKAMFPVGNILRLSLRS